VIEIIGEMFDVDKIHLQIIGRGMKINFKKKRKGA